ncbi:MAG: helix-turn-helix transcriptional regulator, partial [Proteobacteria bacterium]|nr:helix-turn-helix transcriptional regulator [Pseudomonadota bacterium]
MNPTRRSLLVSNFQKRAAKPRRSAISAPAPKGKAASLGKKASSVDPTSKSEKSRDSILKAAAMLFRRQGYSATTLRQIAATAKIEAGSIYYYFGSKEQILDEVLHL